MKKFNKILAAVDFSSHAKNVATHAIDLAKDLKAELVFINVINQKEIDYIYQAESRLSSNSKINVQKCVDQLYEERTAAMEKLKEGLDLGEKKIRFLSKTGVPFQEILVAISEENADVLVMGIKGRSNLADVIVGSTAQKMFRRCPVALLTVR